MRNKKTQLLNNLLKSGTKLQRFKVLIAIIQNNLNAFSSRNFRKYFVSD